MDTIRQKAQSLLEKLHDKYGVQSKHHIHLVVATMGKKEGEGIETQDHWYLVDTHGQKFRLPKTMMFLGREECDVVVASQSVDKRHAILAFDPYLNRFKVKDLSTTNGTFVNNSRIPEQEYVILNHMDSIRLGHDAMMYHIEQASQITNHGGLLPDPLFIPSWASRAQDSATIHVHSHPLTECQGCIAEQHVEHSCGLKHDKLKDGSIHIEDLPHTLHLNPHHLWEHQQPSEAAPILSHEPRSVQSCQQNHPPDQPPHQHKDVASDVSLEQSIPDEDQPITRPSTSNDRSDVPIHDRNTWPMKRQVRQVAHVDSVFNPQQHPHDTESEDHAARNAQTMFFVPFDDLVSDASNSSGPADHGIRAHIGDKHQPPDVATGKKRTPMYGQPPWWGHEDASDEGDSSSSHSSKRDGDGKGTSMNSSPSSLGSNRGESDVSPPAAPATAHRFSGVDSERVRPPKGSTYMEIPLRDHEPSKGGGDPKTSIATTTNINSLPLKDGVSISPEHKQPSKAPTVQSPGVEVSSAMSFTIELDDPEHPPKKSLKFGSSISEFVPTKMRKNFQERKSVPTSKAGSKAGSKDSPTKKDSEERELSPLTQNKCDETRNTLVDCKGKSRLSSLQTAAAVTSLRSPNMADISRLSETSEERRPLEKDAEWKGSVKKAVSSKSPQMPQSSKAISSSNGKPTSASPGISVAEYPDPASFLFDKMFEGGASVSVWTNKEHFPESQQQHKGVVGRDKGICLPAEKAFTRPVIDSTSCHGVTTKNSQTKTAKKPVVHSAHEDHDDLRITEDDSCEVNEKDDKEDKLSETGTYTIEADVKEGQEEEEARRRIDLVFGIDVENVDAQHPVSDLITMPEPYGYDNPFDVGDDSENTLLDDSNHSPDDDTDYILDDFDDENSDMAPSNGLQTWVSQLTSLTNQKSAEANRLSKEVGEVSLSKKPPQSINRKRPGTGRKLPSVPSDKSQAIADHNISVGNQIRITREDVLDHTVSARNNAGNGSKAGAISSQPRSRTIRNGYPSSPSISAGSRNSSDSEASFQGTAVDVMSNKLGHVKRNSQNSDVDIASTVALVNGGDEYVPVLYRSPRDALTRRQQKDATTKPSIAVSTPSGSLGKKLGVKLYSQTVAVTAPKKSPSASEVKKLNVAEMFSRKDSLDNGSVVSDVSSEAGDTSQSKSSSKSKGAITMTRTNKTFDLRRARAGSMDEPSTSRSTKTASGTPKSGANSSAGRSLSVYNSPRSKPSVDTSRSETTGIGVQIVKRSHSNATHETLQKASHAVLSRINSSAPSSSQGLHRARSLTISHTTPGSKRESTPKSHLRSTPTGRSSLTIKGINNISKSQSQPGSRSNSPKAAEKMAWKRRKEYDPRRSVAEAKASKGKEVSTSGVTMRLKPSASSNIHMRMIRSASFTNTAGLSLCLNNSVSSSQEFSDKKDSCQQRHEDLRRAFIPFQNSHHNGRSTHSADEDDSIASATSTQDISKNLVSLLEIPSAFTPPLLRHKPVSPENPSPSEASLSLRRRTLNMDKEASPSITITPHGNGGDKEQPSSQSSSQTSYDSLIVSSVYQLSLKLKAYTNIILNKLRDQSQMTQSPSPDEDFLNDSGRSEITAWRTANQELASTLKNLRMLERHMQIMNTALFPDVDISSEVSLDAPAKRQVKILEDIERKFGFQPIDQPIPHIMPDESEATSPEMVELSGQF